MQRLCGLPIKKFLRFADVWLTLLRVVPRKRPVDNLRRRTGKVDNELGQLPNCELSGISEIEGTDDLILAVHEPYQSVDQIVDIAEGSRLGPIAIDRDIPIAKRLNDEI